MHTHVLGICGTFMAGIALLARELGHRVTGSDRQCYPPISTLLKDQGIEVMDGHDPRQLSPAPDLIVVGNALSRGHPVIEAMLNARLPYTSAPQWLHDHVLRDRWTLAVAGTHGKTTTTAMLLWILERTGRRPGFALGGVPGNLPVSARLGEAPLFVIEADEYDSAFFDKRSKFVHYRPQTLVINNLEYDHADIFPDLAAIQTQFHHLVRTIPGNGMIIHPPSQSSVDAVLSMGCWCATQTFGAGAPAQWRCAPHDPSWREFAVLHQNRQIGAVRWPLFGQHNALNGTAAVAAAVHAGADGARACEALKDFRPPKRRLEALGEAGDVRVFDDFAHHPTAIRATLAALRGLAGPNPITAVLEPRSNTMRAGHHAHLLNDALAEAQRIFLLAPPDLAWDPGDKLAALGKRLCVCTSVDAIVARVANSVRPGEHILIMSNGAFGGIQAKLMEALRARADD